MISIKGRTETALIIKKSKFLGLACRIDSEQEAKDIIEKRKKEHYDASHNCFAYILENGVMRYSDDGEPQGTAGLPMLEVIKNTGFINVLVISTRYFGGTLLGAGGLCRAYTQSAADSLDAAKKVELIKCSVYSCAFSYNTWNKAQNLIEASGYMLNDIEYADEITAAISVIDNDKDAFFDFIADISLGKTIPKPLGEKRIEREI